MGISKGSRPCFAHGPTPVAVSWSYPQPRSRFGIVHRLDFYDVASLALIISGVIGLNLAGVEHVLRLESRPANIEGRGLIAIRDLVKNALRMRPDRIVVGEVRDGAALDMLQAMNTGHDGSITTVHANSPAGAIEQLAMMSMSAGTELRRDELVDYIRSTVDVVIQLGQDAGTRIITEIEFGRASELDGATP